MDRLLGEWGIPNDSAAGRQGFGGRVEARRRAEGAGDYEPQGWCLGSEGFRQELLAQVRAQASPRHTGEEITPSAEAKAERIVGEELQRLGWGPADLEERRKGDPRKLAIAAQLRRESTMTLAWICHHLHMGAPAHVACLLYRREQDESTTENKLF